MNEVHPSLSSEQGQLTATGRVIKVDGQWVEILTYRESGCSGCASQEGCGTSSLSKLFSPESTTPLRLKNTLGAKQGDEVRLSLDESDLIKHSFMAYGLPLLGLFLLAGLANVLFESLFQSDFPSIVGGFLGLVLGWKLTQFFYHPAQPQLTQIIKHGVEND